MSMWMGGWLATASRWLRFGFSWPVLGFMASFYIFFRTSVLSNDRIVDVTYFLFATSCSHSTFTEYESMTRKLGYSRMLTVIFG
jgi:hypothetical protein